MRVEIIAATDFFDWRASELTGYVWEADFNSYVMDDLAEFAGRNCYQSWDRPNPETARNRDYLANIIKQGHYSVFAHASVTFYIDGVSRAFLTELNTHTFIKTSSISQRYVDPSVMGEPVIPPAIRGTEAERIIRDVYDYAAKAYGQITTTLQVADLSRKQVREAARAVLPNSAPVKTVVSGNLLAWRDFLAKRYHVAADAEMQEAAYLILGQLRCYAPHSFQDFPSKPFGSE